MKRLGIHNYVSGKCRDCGGLLDLSFHMVDIPAGEFLFSYRREQKFLPQYQIMKYPVTVAQYLKFCQAAGKSMPPAPPWGWRENYPMVFVYWSEAAAFAKWAGMSLPTHEEWEKAARGTDGREYPWGNDWDGARCVNNVKNSTCQHKENYLGEWCSIAPVGIFPDGASVYGVNDVVGNIWEHCEKKHILLGGSGFQSDMQDFRAYKILFDVNSDTGRRRVAYGFRCVLSGDTAKK
jgi:formylglycine-generating enzyme required for sulfatase activity